jgi:pimeloyl-ACP methyl ester carboxylesterase
MHRSTTSLTGGAPLTVARSAYDRAAELVRTMRALRFENASIAHIPEAGHWPHVEQPARLAEVLTEFLAHIP